VRRRVLVRKQVSQEPLFYRPDEIARPSKQNRYVQLMEAGLDWEKLAKPFEAAFSRGLGRPTDPIVYLKIFLVAYFEDITYDTKLADRIADSIAIRQFLGYNLCESTPDHSSISRNRGMIAGACGIGDVLTKVVKECIALGMVDGDLAAVDGSLVAANASLSSLQSKETGKSVRDHLKEVAEKNKLAAQSGEKKGKPKVSNEEFASKTDPDARIAQKHSSPRDMCYLVTHVTDSRNGIILAAGCTHPDDGETEAARPVLEQAKENLTKSGLRLKRVGADSGYDDSKFISFVEGLGAEPIINYQQDSVKKPDGFRKESFTYDKERDCYICPRGCLLRYKCPEPARNRRKYVSSASDCLLCPDRNKCLGEGSSTRWVSRLDGEQSREENIARCHTDEGRAALRARKHIVEPPFGHMKTYGGMRLINCRGKKRASVKAVMAAAAYDLIKLVKFIAGKRRKEASTAMLGAGVTAAMTTTASSTVQIERCLAILLAQWLQRAQMLLTLIGSVTHRHRQAWAR
jgi:transposase